MEKDIQQDKEIDRLRDIVFNHVITSEKRLTKLEVNVSWLKKHLWWVLTLTITIVNFALDKAL